MSDRSRESCGGLAEALAKAEVPRLKMVGMAGFEPTTP